MYCKQVKMLSIANWEAPTQNRIIPIDDTFTVHSLSDLINLICGKNFCQEH